MSVPKQPLRADWARTGCVFLRYILDGEINVFAACSVASIRTPSGEAMQKPPDQPGKAKQVRLPQKPGLASQGGAPALPQKRVVSDRPSWERGPGENAPSAHANIDPAQQRMPYRPIPQPVESEGGTGGWGQVGLGALMAGGGTVGTFVSYSNASGGGRYTVFWGLILVGIITLIKGFATIGKS